MQRYILVRLFQAVVTLWLVSIAVFGLARLTGNPLDVLLPLEATQEDYARMTKVFGLDQPIYVQYGVFLNKALHGDFGTSYRFRRPALDIVIERIPASAELGAVAFLIAMLIAIPAGVYSAINRGTLLDNFVRGAAVLGQSLPHFWTGIVLILIFAVWLHWLPVAGTGGIRHLVLPAITLGYFLAAGVMRLTRSAMLEVLDAEYIKLARSKGLSEFIVTWKHAFKNAMVPILTFSALILVQLLIGSIVVETVFAWPGISRLAVESVKFRDFAVLQTIVLLMAGLYIFGNLIADIMYAYVNPKIRY